MAQKIKTRKERKQIIQFLRMFPEYRELENTILKKDEAQDLSAAIIRTYKENIEWLQKKAEHDDCLIVSFNRYIETLERKINYQTELLKEQKERLEVLIAAYYNK